MSRLKFWVAASTVHHQSAFAVAILKANENTLIVNASLLPTYLRRIGGRIGRFSLAAEMHRDGRIRNGSTRGALDYNVRGE